MPFTNFSSRHFTVAEKADVTGALQTLAALLEPKLANLSPEERQQYGSINEQNKLIVSKVKDYRDAQPALASPDVDWDEFQKDYDTRSFLQSVIQQLQSLTNGLGNAKILHDWDNYQASLTDYDYSKYKFSTEATGYETKVNELRQFFAGRPSGSTSASSGEPAGD